MIRIYVVTNTVNGKKYVGQTSQGVGRRWTNHCAVANKRASSYFSNAIRKHGRNNFHVETVAEIDTREWADYLESMWILCLGTFDPKVGYNLTTGGNSHKHIAPSAVAKVRQKRVGFKHSEESKQRLSESLKAAYAEGRKKSLKGFRFSEESRAKLSEIHSGDKHWNFNDQVNIEDITKLRAQGMYMREIAETLNVSVFTIERRVKKSGIKLPRVPVRLSDETRTKMSLASRGRVASDTTRELIRKIVTETWAKRKQNESSRQSSSA